VPAAAGHDGGRMRSRIALAALIRKGAMPVQGKGNRRDDGYRDKAFSAVGLCGRALRGFHLTYAGSTTEADAASSSSVWPSRRRSLSLALRCSPLCLTSRMHRRDPGKHLRIRRDEGGDRQNPGVMGCHRCGPNRLAFGQRFDPSTPRPTEGRGAVEGIAAERGNGGRELESGLESKRRKV
jgi:hypothetical protein